MSFIPVVGGAESRTCAARPARTLHRVDAARFPNAFAFPLLLIGLLLAVTVGGSTAAWAADAPGALDLNRATAEQLEALPGIGEVKAAAILAVRDERGGFASLDELESVRGIGPALAMRLRPLLKVDPKTRPRTRTAQK